MASKDTRSKRYGKKTKEQPKSVGKVSVPASEPTKKRARKRKLNDDGDSSPARNQTSKPKPEKTLNESASSEPVKRERVKPLTRRRGKAWMNTLTLSMFQF